MIIEVKTVEILAKQKMQFEATTVVKEEKLIKFMTGFKNSLKETRNDGYIKEVALHLEWMKTIILSHVNMQK